MSDRLRESLQICRELSRNLGASGGEQSRRGPEIGRKAKVRKMREGAAATKAAKAK